MDQNCDVQETCYADGDNDNARHMSSTVLSPDSDCADTFEALFTDPIDCNDSNSAIFPGAAELIGDEVDQNCNFSAINPSASEIVDDGTDQNCDGGDLCYVDGDDDGARTAGTAGSADLDCLGPQEGATGDPLDCDDNDGTVHPGAVELCDDSLDNNCNTTTDCADSYCSAEVICTQVFDHLPDPAPVGAIQAMDKLGDHTFEKMKLKELCASAARCSESGKRCTGQEQTRTTGCRRPSSRPGPQVGADRTDPESRSTGSNVRRTRGVS